MLTIVWPVFVLSSRVGRLGCASSSCSLDVQRHVLWICCRALPKQQPACSAGHGKCCALGRVSLDSLLFAHLPCRAVAHAQVRWSGDRCCVCDIDIDYDYDQLVSGLLLDTILTNPFAGSPNLVWHPSKHCIMHVACATHVQPSDISCQASSSITWLWN